MYQENEMEDSKDKALYKNLKTNENKCMEKIMLGQYDRDVED